MTQKRIVVDPVTSLEVCVPDFANDAEAIERHSRLLRGQIRRAEMFPELGTRDVLWGIEIGPSSVRDLGASVELAAEIDAWRDWWERESDPQTGWAASEDERNWTVEGVRLWRLLSKSSGGSWRSSRGSSQRITLTSAGLATTVDDSMDG